MWFFSVLGKRKVTWSKVSVEVLGVSFLNFPPKRDHGPLKAETGSLMVNRNAFKMIGS